MSGDVTPYTDLVTSAWRTKPNFMASVVISAQPQADTVAVLASMPGLYDLDDAVGDQLDKVGARVGATRDLGEPLLGVYFAWDTPGMGWDQGSWLGPFDPVDGLVFLPDDAFRSLIKATIQANQWDGSVPGAYAAYDTLFGPGSVLIQDLQSMSMLLALTTLDNDATTLALFSSGALSLRPAGVNIAHYMVPGGAGPYFGFDVESSVISGWDTGRWGQVIG